MDRYELTPEKRAYAAARKTVTCEGCADRYPVLNETQAPYLCEDCAPPDRKCEQCGEPTGRKFCLPCHTTLSRRGHWSTR